MFCHFSEIMLDANWVLKCIYFMPMPIHRNYTPYFHPLSSGVFKRQIQRPWSTAKKRLWTFSKRRCDKNPSEQSWGRSVKTTSATTWMDPGREVDGSMVHKWMKFHLLVNGIFLGVITHPLIRALLIHPLPGLLLVTSLGCSCGKLKQVWTWGLAHRQIKSVLIC